MKSEYVDLVVDNVDKLNKSHKMVNEVVSDLERYGITKGMLQSYFNKPNLLHEEDKRIVALIGEQISIHARDSSFSLKSNFHPKEIDDIHAFYLQQEDDTIDFPYVIEDVTRVGNGAYVFALDYALLARLWMSQKLYYNFDVQREAKYTKRQGEIIRTPDVKEKSVKEITKHLLNGTLVSTSIAINAALGSSETGDEIIYDSKQRTLTITESTRLDILDGMHRTTASVRAYVENKNLNFEFIGMIFNYDTRSAQAYQAQLAKANPISKSRAKELDATRWADEVVRLLKIDGDLKDRVTSRDIFTRNEKEIVSYGILSNAIDYNFNNIKTKYEALQVADYLKEYFMYLFGYYSDYLMSNDNLMFQNQMFAGHIMLAKKMRDSNISLSSLDKALNQLDFSRNSIDMEPMLDKYKNVNVKNSKQIYNIIDNIKLDLI